MSTPIMNQYHAIKAEHKDYLVFFRLGDFYELFYDDAILAAEILGITLTRRVQKEENIPMAGVPFHTCEHYIAKLVKAGQKIAVCEQIGTAAQKEDKIIKREVVRIITPGTLTDDSLLEAKRNNFLMALHAEGLMIYASVFDLSTNEFFVEEFETASLKEALQKIDPVEILITQHFLVYFPDYKEWENAITFVPSVENPGRKIGNFFKLHSLESLNLQAVHAQSVAMVLSYIELTQKSIPNIALPKIKSFTNELQMDKFTRRNLELTKTLQGERVGSLLWLLDHTKTAQGGRLLFKYINEPIKDIEQLNERYSKIEFFLADHARLSRVIDLLKEVPDFERILSKIALRRSNPSELLVLAKGIMAFEKLIRMLDLKNILIKHDNIALAQKIIQAISDEQENGFIKAGYDQEIDSLRAFEENLESEIAQLQERYRREVSIATLRIKLHQNFGYLVEVNSSQKEKLAYNFVLRQDLKTTARYSTAQLENISLRAAESNERIAEREAQLFAELCAGVLSIADDVNLYAKYSAEYDVFSNFAKISLENDYVKPVLTQDNKFEIEDGRHPVLDYILKSRGEQFVSNNCDLQKCVMFMTGPNMAGKSTYLRQQALILLLAHIGMYVPAKSAKIGVADHIFSRIGANDNLIEGNSTFMMEMIEIALTLNQATRNSFIVFDEVGRGTSVEEGMAIAESILEYLVNTLKARALFATHYLALQRISHENLQQKRMEIIEDPICFTHRILDGVAKKSYALTIAKLAGMPSLIVKRAEEILSNSE